MQRRTKLRGSHNTEKKKKTMITRKTKQKIKQNETIYINRSINKCITSFVPHFMNKVTAPQLM